MKKITIIATILLVLISSITGVSADSSPKDVDVILSDTPAIMNLGETVELKATAPKHGSTYIDSWENVGSSYTDFDMTTSTYISKAIFKPEKAGIYNIRYTIKMLSGGSDTVFYRTVERTIEVVNPVAVVGAVIKDLSVTPLYNAEGNICYYRAGGSVYALWSDKTETPTDSSVYFFFGADEASKDLNVSFSIDGKEYNYIVTVNR